MATIRTDTNYRKRLIRVGMRPPNLPVSRLLPDNWDNLPRTNHPLECRCVNSPFNLKRLIYEHEERKGMLYLYEGLITTYPSDKFADAFLKKVGEVVPDELRSITMDDIGLFEDDDTPVIENIVATPLSNGVASMITFTVPVYREDIAKLGDKVKSIAKDISIYGYYLTDVEEIEHELSDDIAVVKVQFEAKFPNDKFWFKDTLYHVSPLKYLDKIRRNGLVPGSKSKEFGYEDRVYLFNDMPIDRVLQYGKDKAKVIGDSGFCLFSIQRDNLRSMNTYKSGKLKFYVDSAYGTENGVEALFTYGNIPLSVIDNEFKIYPIDDLSSPMTGFFGK